MEMKVARIASTPVAMPVTGLLRYSGAGLIGTAIHFTILFASLNYVGPVLASSLGAIAGCVVNYSLARDFVFCSSTSFTNSFPPFATVALLGIGVNALIINMLADLFHILLCQVVASGAVLSFGFVANKRWTFNGC